MIARARSPNWHHQFILKSPNVLLQSPFSWSCPIAHPFCHHFKNVFWHHIESFELCSFPSTIHHLFGVYFELPIFATILQSGCLVYHAMRHKPQLERTTTRPPDTTRSPDIIIPPSNITIQPRDSTYSHQTSETTTLPSYDTALPVVSTTLPSYNVRPLESQLDVYPW